MSSPPGRNPPEPKPSTSSKTDVDPALDCSSENFDALRALYAPNPPNSNKNVKLYDNLACFEASLTKLGLLGVGRLQNKPPAKPQTRSAEETAKPTDTSDIYLDIPNRRFFKHQAPIPSTGIKERHNRSLFLNLQKLEGPYAALYRFMMSKQRVKVYTRKEKGVRGVTTGNLVVFDKNWNIVLEDACEVWKRRKFKFSENKTCAGEPKDCTESLKMLGITLPDIQVKSLNRKTVQCTRHVKQLMICGNQVVLIAADNAVKNEVAKEVKMEVEKR